MAHAHQGVISDGRAAGTAGLPATWDTQHEGGGAPMERKASLPLTTRMDLPRVCAK